MLPGGVADFKCVSMAGVSHLVASCLGVPQFIETQRQSASDMALLLQEVVLMHAPGSDPEANPPTARTAPPSFP